MNGVDGDVPVVIQITDDPSAERNAPPRSTHVRNGDVLPLKGKELRQHILVSTVSTLGYLVPLLVQA